MKRRQPPLRVLSSHGTALMFIARHPGCTVRDLMEGLVVTRRTVWSLMADLRRAGLIRAEREGRRHRYSLNGDAPLPDAVLDGVTVHECAKALAVAGG